MGTEVTVKSVTITVFISCLVHTDRQIKFGRVYSLKSVTITVFISYLVHTDTQTDKVCRSLQSVTIPVFISFSGYWHTTTANRIVRWG